MIANLLLQNLIWFGAMGAMLLVSAGTLNWPTACASRVRHRRIPVAW